MVKLFLHSCLQLVVVILHFIVIISCFILKELTCCLGYLPVNVRPFCIYSTVRKKWVGGILHPPSYISEHFFLRSMEDVKMLRKMK